MDFLSKALHESSKNSFPLDSQPSDPSTWPEEWKTIYYKEYPRFESVNLHSSLKPDANLVDLISNRKTERDFSGQPLTFEELSALLSYSSGEFGVDEREKKHRAYPSGGARYPTETYVLLPKPIGNEIKSGIHHYNVRKNSLEFLWSLKDESVPDGIVRDGWIQKASALFFLTTVFWRAQNKYQDRGYRYLCIEVGALIQNFYLLSGALGLGCAAYAGTNDGNIEDLLDLDSANESLISTVIIGKKV